MVARRTVAQRNTSKEGGTGGMGWDGFFFFLDVLLVMSRIISSNRRKLLFFRAKKKRGPFSSPCQGPH